MLYLLERIRGAIAVQQYGGPEERADLTVGGVTSIPYKLRRIQVPHLIRRIEGFSIAEYRKEALVAYCYRSVGSYRDAFLHFDNAISVHPEQTEESDFPAHVDGYLEALGDIQRLPQEDRKDLHKMAIERLTGLLPVLPDMEYKLRGSLGVSCDGIGQMGRVLGYHE